jgi:hypothetical protein
LIYTGFIGLTDLIFNDEGEVSRFSIRDRKIRIHGIRFKNYNRSYGNLIIFSAYWAILLYS